MIGEINKKEMDALQCLANAAANLNISLMLVGANARRLGFDLPFHLPPARATDDWDFAVHVPDWDTYHRLYNSIVMGETAPFRPTSISHRVVYKEHDVEMDLVPFGRLANQDGNIRWPKGDAQMSVLGFEEAFNSAMQFSLPDGQNIRVVNPAMLAVLKIIAFSDRGANIARDLQDLWYILQHYATPDVHLARAYEEMVPHFPGDEYYEHLASLLLGWDIARHCRPQTLTSVRPILHNLTQGLPSIRILLPSTADIDARDQKYKEITLAFAWLQKGIDLALTSNP